MKKYILLNLLLLSLTGAELARAQCIKEISTNPDNPVNNEFLPIVNGWYGTSYTNNSFLNTFDWRYPNQVIIDLNGSWQHPLNSPSSGLYPMWNPFGSGMPDEFIYLRNEDDVTYGDFHWEDGWELLWSNLGKYPNGDDILNPADETFYGEQIPTLTYAPTPSYIPYFVLYNRYTGLMRLFASIFDDELSASFQKARVTLEYTGSSAFNNKVSGILRNVAGYDQALDQKTNVLQILSPRFHAGNTNQWFVAEFQMAFDPCGCNSKGELVFKFQTFETMTINMQSRGISIEEQLTEANVADHSFLNLPSEPSADNPIPGTAIYQKMDGLMDSYKNKLEKYNQDMADYKAYENNLLINFVEASKTLVVGAANLLPAYSVAAKFLSIKGKNWGLTEPDKKETKAAGSYTDGQEIDDGKSITYVSVEGDKAVLHTYSYDKLQKSLADEGKKALCTGYDFLSAQIFGKKPDKPIKPQAPVATFTETVFVGTISKDNLEYSTNLLVPGSWPNAYTGVVDITPFNYPAYNETLGLFALLKTPEFDKNHSPGQPDTISGSYSGGGILRNEQSDIGNPIIVYGGSLNTEITDNLLFKLDEGLVYAFNHTVDLDNLNTKQFVQFELEYEVSGDITNLEVEAMHGSNFHISHVFPAEANTVILNSKWYGMEDLGKVLFGSVLRARARVQYEKHEENHLYTPDEYDDDGNLIPRPQYTTWYEGPLGNNLSLKLTKVKMKILNDMYYDQIGSYGDPVNHTQSFTYLLFNESEGIDKFFEGVTSSPMSNYYLPGLLEIGHNTIGPNSSEVTKQVGNDLYVDAEEIRIVGHVQALGGYNVHLRALSKIDMVFGSSLGVNVNAALVDFFPSFPKIKEASQQDVSTFCSNQVDGYKANIPADGMNKTEFVTEKEKDNEAEPAVLSLSCHPNPTTQNVFVSVENSTDWLEVNLFDMQGRLIIKERVFGSMAQKFELDLNGVGKGIYLLRVSSSEGQNATKRVVKL